MPGEDRRGGRSQSIPRPTRGDPLSPATHRLPTSSGLGPPCLALGANPFPEVTDTFCRLPLPTLFHRLEVVYLGDLMWLWVQPGMGGTRSFKFSRAAGGALDITRHAMLFQLLDPTSSWAISRVGRLLNKKDNSSRGPRRCLRTP